MAAFFYLGMNIKGNSQGAQPPYRGLAHELSY